MFNLSIKEQKEILGGRFKLTVYYGPGYEIVAEKSFTTHKQAKAWLDEHYPNCGGNGQGYHYDIEEI
ncbi:hypothetical protein [Anaerosacchariphilus polymeriproducens]|uniref:Uncharacterized protein n=1 Tax=Anaerosacchariphilus polymeriproducens TaxID=1812858 RepID=A0A371AQK3_9FIRM|nr:hypothetical protein [Anaerosacchariphilus polymeriproducens]RDU21856.1 hypothetical protein DWV06_17900 [Anaerosacchariphilus polymeriproducens]